MTREPRGLMLLQRVWDTIRWKRPRRHSIQALAVLAIILTAVIVMLDALAPRRLEQIDEGQFLFYAHALTQGQVLYRDVWYQFGPLLVYGLVAAWSVFGKTVAVARAYFWVLNLLGLAAGGLVLARFTRSVLLTAVGVLLLESSSMICRVQMVNPSFLLRQCLPLLPLLLAAKGLSAEPKSQRSLFIAGVLGGLSLLVSQETGAFSLIAISAAVIVRGMFPGAIPYAHPWALLARFPRSLRAPAGLLCPVLLGAALPIALWLVYTLLRGSLPTYLSATLIDTFTMVSEHQHRGLPGLDSLMGGEFGTTKGLRGFLHYHGWFLLTYVPLAIYTVGAVAVWRSRRTLFAHELLLLLVFAVLCWSVNLGRSDRFHAAFAAGGAIVLGLALCSMRSTSKSERQEHGSRSLRVFVAICLALVFWSGLDAPYRLFVLARREAATYSTSFPHSGGAKIPTQQATWFRLITAQVLEHSAKTDSLFVMPHDPALHFFTGLKNPTRFACPIFASTLQQRDEILEALTRDPPQCVVTNTGSFVGGIDYEYYIGPFRPMLRGYRSVARIGSAEVWVRVR